MPHAFQKEKRAYLSLQAVLPRGSLRISPPMSGEENNKSSKIAEMAPQKFCLATLSRNANGFECVFGLKRAKKIALSFRILNAVRLFYANVVSLVWMRGRGEREVFCFYFSVGFLSFFASSFSEQLEPEFSARGFLGIKTVSHREEGRFSLQIF